MRDITCRGLGGVGCEGEDGGEWTGGYGRISALDLEKD